MEPTTTPRETQLHANPRLLIKAYLLLKAFVNVNIHPRFSCSMQTEQKEPNGYMNKWCMVLLEEPQVLPADFVVFDRPQTFMHEYPWVHIDDYVPPASTLCYW